jgi:hypothetical protein
VGITERSAFGIVTDLAEAGYVVKQKDGRRNRYQIQAHLPLPEPASQEPAIGDVLALLAGTGAGQPLTGRDQPEATAAERVSGYHAGSLLCEPGARTLDLLHIINARHRTESQAILSSPDRRRTTPADTDLLPNALPGAAQTAGTG